MFSKKQFIWVGKMSWFGFKYLACHPKNKCGLVLKRFLRPNKVMEMVDLPVKTHSFWFPCKMPGHLVKDGLFGSIAD